VGDLKSSKNVVSDADKVEEGEQGIEKKIDRTKVKQLN